jgi:RNA-directed DNA polymerase
MRKQLEEIGVGQLTLTFGDLPIDDAEETQDNGPVASSSDPAAKRNTERLKWHSLIDKVYAMPNLRAACSKVQDNGGAPGIDGMTVEKFAEHADKRLTELHADLRNKTYRPQPVRRVHIPKPGGGSRPLGIPTVRDRIVQQAILQVLEPIFDPMFSKHSHGFRKGKGCATALDVVDRAIRHGYTWVVDADIASFFDTVDHELLLDALNVKVADGSLLRLIRKILKAGVSLPETSATEPTELGTPQGGPLSPLLANIYLHAFDVRIGQAGYGIVRYADDFVIFARSESKADAALTLARSILEGQLKVRLHPEKTRVVSVDEGFEFLGFHYFRDQKKGLSCKEVRAKSVARFRDEIRKRTPRLHAQRAVKREHLTRERLRRNKRVSEMLRSVNAYLRGWHWYFKAMRSRYDPPFETFDGYTRGRIRSAIVGRVGNGWWTVHLDNAFMRQIGYTGVEDLDAQYRAGLLDSPARKGRAGGEPYAGNPHVRFG